MDSGDIILAIVCLVLGGIISGVISWFTSRWYYRQAASDSDRSMGRLLTSDAMTRRMVNAVGHALANVGFEVAFDKDGNMVPNVEGEGEWTLPPLRMRGEGTVSPPSVYDRQHENPSAGPEGG